MYNYFKNINNTEYTEDESTQPNNFDTEAEQVVNEQINRPITESEIEKAIKNLKNNKSSGLDNIKNEHIKVSSTVMLPIYTKLFNLIFDHGFIPESWSVGTIKPIYKHKGDPKMPENYRPITILSCLGKLFTAVINNRLNEFAEENDLIEPCQAGFRKQHSTADNIFIIKSLIDILKTAKNKKLLCCFVDFKQAFDSVWRERLWEKLTMHNINGKCLRFIQNMYKSIKSRVAVNNDISVFFPCLQGVRQGENLSPFLFTIFLNDLETYLFTNQASGVSIDLNYDELTTYLKVLILLFADDTVLFATTESELQYTLKLFEHYCEHMKLTVNVSKTKIIVFTNSRTNTNTQFSFQSKPVEIVADYKYLGIVFAKNGSFTLAKKHIAEQANKALFALLKKINGLDLPYDLQLDIFNKTVKPILLYGSEIWGFGNCDILERIHLRFIKYIFQLKKSTPSHMIYGELGIFPVTVEIQSRIISYWCKLIENANTTKLSSSIYAIIHAMYENKHLKSQWLDNVKHLLCSQGYSGIWYSQSFTNAKWLTNSFQQKLKDLYMQKWYSSVNMSSSNNNYKLFKDRFEISSYINKLSPYLCKRFLAFRTRNHRFPIELGRWHGTPLNDRKCNLCNSDLGDEFHYLLVCKTFETERKCYLKPYYYRSPSILKYHNLMNTKDENSLKKLCKFIDILLKTVR